MPRPGIWRSFPNGKTVYAFNELASTVAVLDYNGTCGILSRVEELATLPADFNGSNSSAEIQVDRAGKFLYTSNRGYDSIAVFAIDPANQTLTSLEPASKQGKVPRNFALDPTGSYLFAA